MSLCNTLESSRASWTLYEILKTCITNFWGKTFQKKGRIAPNNSYVSQKPLNLSCGEASKTFCIAIHKLSNTISAIVWKQKRIFSGCQPHSKAPQDMLKGTADNRPHGRKLKLPKCQPANFGRLCCYWYL